MGCIYTLFFPTSLFSGRSQHTGLYWWTSVGSLPMRRWGLGQPGVWRRGQKTTTHLIPCQVGIPPSSGVQLLAPVYYYYYYYYYHYYYLCIILYTFKCTLSECSLWDLRRPNGSYMWVRKWREKPWLWVLLWTKRCELWLSTQLDFLVVGHHLHCLLVSYLLV